MNNIRFIWASSESYAMSSSPELAKTNNKLIVINHGPAICSVVELDDGTLWVENDEYASQVNFCPMTGYEAKTKIG